MQEDTQFEINLSRILAFSVVYESRKEDPLELYRNEADARPPTPKQTGLNIGTIFESSFPGIVGQTTGAINPIEQALISAQEQLGPRRASAESKVFSDLLSSVAGGEAAALKGTGGDVVRQVDALGREVDPGYYQSRDAIAGTIGQGAQGVSQLFNPISEGEISAVERGLNRFNLGRGTAYNPSGGSEFLNALTFAGAGRDRLSQAIQAASGFVPAAASALQPSRSIEDVKNTAISNPAVIQNAFTNTQLGAPAFGLSQGLLGTVGSLEEGRQANDLARRGTFETVAGSLPNYS